MLADRFGGRRVFAALLVLSAVPAAAIGFSTGYTQLLFLGLFLGLAGTTFPVGVGFTSKWFSAESRGTALGVYGMGNIGQSVAVFGAPVLAAYAFGGNWRPVFFVFAAAALLWGVVFYLFARDAATNAKPKTLSENSGVLKRQPLAWVLSLFYFLTFGGFFPPLALGLIRDATGGYAWGFVFLACFALACLAVHYFVLVRPGGGAKSEKSTLGSPVLN